MKKHIAQLLLKSKAVTLSPTRPYTYVSGIRSPIYCDNRLLISHPEWRRNIIQAFDEIIQEHHLAFDVIAGTATAGIPWAAWLAEKYNKPLVYIRATSKEHGKGNQIEGHLPRDKSVIVIEDLISTGGSSLTAIQAVRDAGALIQACLAIFTYEMKKAINAFSIHHIPLYCTSNFTTLIQVATEEKYISEPDKKILLEWHQNPEGWGKQHGY